MYECKIPYFGYIKLSKEDFLFISLAVFLLCLAILNLFIMNIMTGIILSIVQIVFSLVLILISIYNGKLRIQQEEYVNPLKQMEAYKNHALAEGI